MDAILQQLIEKNILIEGSEDEFRVIQNPDAHRKGIEEISENCLKEELPGNSRRIINEIQALLEVTYTASRDIYTDSMTKSTDLSDEYDEMSKAAGLYLIGNFKHKNEHNPAGVERAVDKGCGPLRASHQQRAASQVQQQSQIFHASL